MSEKGKRAQRFDWEAIKRDWRTGKFTQAELATKHKVNPATLNRKIKADRAADPEAWPKDLTEAVRLATNARVITEMVKAEIKGQADKVKGQEQRQEAIAKGQEQVKDAVAMAAEMSANVILKHQKDLGEAREVAMGLLGELRDSALLTEDKELLAEILAGEGAKPEDLARARTTVRRALEVGTRISAVKAMTDALSKLQERERVAFSLDVKEPAAPGSEDGSMGAVDAANRIAFLLASVKDRAK